MADVDEPKNVVVRKFVRPDAKLLLRRSTVKNNSCAPPQVPLDGVTEGRARVVGMEGNEVFYNPVQVNVSTLQFCTAPHCLQYVWSSMTLVKRHR